MDDLPVFLRRLRDEHRAFDRSFRELHRAARETRDPVALEALRILCDDFLTAYHQEREERFLFPRLRGDPRLNAGGPECTLHFDFYLADRPLDRAVRAGRSAGIPTDGPRWEGPAREDQKTNSPLCIPGEDHEAGRVLLRALRALPASDDPDLFDRRLKLLETFETIQRTHHRREEGCFFFVCLGILTPAAWAEIEAADAPWRPPPAAPAVQVVIASLAKAGWTRIAA